MTERIASIFSLGAFAFALATLGCGVASSELVLRPLGAAPLCEASALLRVPDGSGRWLVADNEIDDRLFVFEEKNGLLAPAPVPSMSLPGLPADVEALAWVDGELIAVGSHSRGKRCKRGGNRKRRAIARFALRQAHPSESPSSEETEVPFEARPEIEGGDEIDRIQRSKASIEDCLEALFERPAPMRSELVCAALLAAEKNATREQCTTFNIEGAVSAPDLSGRDRLWIGLRSPLVEGRAALLRLAEDPTSLRFDAVALLDLSGAGIRGLDRVGARLVGIAGPARDGQGNAWFVSPLPSPGDLYVATQLRELPRKAEGIAGTEEALHVVLDGAAAAGETNACDEPARQALLPRLP